MRVAVISDIHANYHALEAVFAAIDREQPDEIWCLGDLVGYGPQPNRSCTAVAGRVTVCLCGNHDLAVLGALSIETFTPDAAEAARWSASVLTDDARIYLGGLAPSLRRKDAELYHASPRDPVWDYVMTEEAVFDSLALTTAPLVLVGHTHLPLALTQRGNSITGGLAPGGTEVALEEGRWLLNPGSVGQPRDGDPRAAWLLIDFEAKLASFRRTEYPVERTQEEIVAAGLPAALATRLALGQ
jgi:predicted phosphodiesterase